MESHPWRRSRDRPAIPRRVDRTARFPNRRCGCPGREAGPRSRHQRSCGSRPQSCPPQRCGLPRRHAGAALFWTVAQASSGCGPIEDRSASSMEQRAAPSVSVCSADPVEERGYLSGYRCSRPTGSAGQPAEPCGTHGTAAWGSGAGAPPRCHAPARFHLTSDARLVRELEPRCGSQQGPPTTVNTACYRAVRVSFHRHARRDAHGSGFVGVAVLGAVHRAAGGRCSWASGRRRCPWPVRWRGGVRRDVRTPAARTAHRARRPRGAGPGDRPQ